MTNGWPPEDAVPDSGEGRQADPGSEPEWPDEAGAAAASAPAGLEGPGTDAEDAHPAAAPEEAADDDSAARAIGALLGQELLVPIRSSSGESPDPVRLSLDSMRHGTDAQGRFLAAFSDLDAFSVLGPPGSDHVVMGGRELCERAERADERVIVNPGSPDQVEIPAGVLPFLLAGIDLASPAALRSLRPLGGLPDLEAPQAIPEPFGGEMRAALEELPAVERAWLLRVGTAWTVGVQLAEDAPLSEFDVARNRLHALATEHLGSRRNLIVTDLRAPSLRAHYESVAAPFYEPPAPKGFFTRLLGLDR